jgi:hypothetical protein
MRLIYSVAYTTYDAQARAHRQTNTWISGARHQALTRDGIERIVHREHPHAIILQTQVFTDSRFS